MLFKEGDEMIKRIVLKNFKCFDNLDAKISKITLLTGANSSGKSSFLQSILLLAQSDQFPLNLSLNGRYAQLGGYKELVFKHNSSKDIELHVEYDASRLRSKKTPAVIVTRWGISHSGKTIKCKEVRITTSKAEMVTYLTDSIYKLKFLFPDEYRQTL
jgi:predicted ATP-dependent endonuclease of OLD family